MDSKLTEGLDMWGMFSPKWNTKLKYPVSHIKLALESNPGHDVYLFNHARVTDALTLNVWEQGEMSHPGIYKVAKKALEIAGYDYNILNAVTGKYTCYSHSFVATKAFWTEFLQFLHTIKSILDHQLPPEEDLIYKSPAGYKIDSSLTMFPFIIERMLSTFLCLKQYNVYKHPYDFSVYQVASEDKEFFVSLFESLIGLKEQAIATSSPEFYKYWDNFRKVTRLKYPDIISLDSDK